MPSHQTSISAFSFIISVCICFVGTVHSVHAQNSSYSPSDLRYRSIGESTDEKIENLVQQLPHLESLRLSDCDTVSPEAIGKLSSLELRSLSLSYNHSNITPEICRAIAQLPTLKKLSLNINETQLSYACILELAQLESLRELRLDSRKANNSTINSLVRKCPQITKLCLSSFQTLYNNETCRLLAKSRTIESIVFWINRLKIDNRGLAHLGRMKQLRHLDLRADFDAEGLEHLTSLKNLEHLDVHTDRIDGDCLRAIGRMKSLKRLFLNHMPITDEDIAHLRSLTNLEYLQLIDTEITGEGFSQLQTLTSLTALDVDNSHFNPDNAYLLAPLKNLKYLDFGYTTLEDSYKSYFGKGYGTLDQLTQLESLGWDGSREDMKALHEKLPHVHISRTDVSVNLLPKNENTERENESQ